jgi:hypothetical protein
VNPNYIVVRFHQEHYLLWRSLHHHLQILQDYLALENQKQYHHHLHQQHD